MRAILGKLTPVWITLTCVSIIHAQVDSPFAPPPQPSAGQEVGGSAAASAPTVPNIDYSVTPTPTAGDVKPLEGGEILAKIDGQIVLASDVLWQVNLLLKANSDRIPAAELEDARRALLRQHVMGLIDTKVLYAEFRRKVPAENLPKIEESLAEPFEEMEVPRLCEALEVADKRQLDELLKANGSSLADLRRQFNERTIAGEWLRSLAPKPKPITHEELLEYYQQHTADFDYPAQVKWEELAVDFAKVNFDRAAAWRMIAEMGNKVWQQVAQNPGLRGPAFTDVAKECSHGITAGDGGVHDWTTRGALRCGVIDEALFSLELGQMSDVIESDTGFHIVRVLERRDAGRTPFTEAQAEIRKIIEASAKKDLASVELDKLRDKARIWTIFDGEFRGSELTAQQRARRAR